MNDRLIAWAQIALSVLLLLGYLVLLLVKGLGLLKLDSSDLSGLSALVGVAIYFWFQRQRAGGDAAAAASAPTLPPALPAVTSEVK